MRLFLQAMDRAHRLGQRKVVNVHRLIMRGTLEEKVMNLQKFKVSIANAVINAENASMKTMNTDQLLDLFTSAETTSKKVYCIYSSDLFCSYKLYTFSIRNREMHSQKGKLKQPKCRVEGTQPKKATQSKPFHPLQS